MKTSPKYVFLHLLLIGALYISAFSFVNLIFQYINIFFPDNLNFYHGEILNSIRSAMAALFIIFPVYLLTGWLLKKDFKKWPELKELKIRKWLIYLTLFIASIAVIADLVTLVFNFLNGELTIRFILKSLIILLVAVGVFLYYLWDIKPNKASQLITKIMIYKALVLVLISVLGGFALIGSPRYQRQVRFDEQRISDLQNIQWSIINYWQKKNDLPPTLDRLKDDISGFIPPVDPRSGKDYQYKINSNLSFELCAEFETDNSNFPSWKNYDERPMPIIDREQNWRHKASNTCFQRLIDPELYLEPSRKPVF